MNLVRIFSTLGLATSLTGCGQTNNDLSCDAARKEFSQGDLVMSGCNTPLFEQTPSNCDHVGTIMTFSESSRNSGSDKVKSCTIQIDGFTTLPSQMQKHPFSSQRFVRYGASSYYALYPATEGISKQYDFLNTAQNVTTENDGPYCP